MIAITQRSTTIVPARMERTAVAILKDSQTRKEISQPADTQVNPRINSNEMKLKVHVLLKKPFITTVTLADRRKPV